MSHLPTYQEALKKASSAIDLLIAENERLKRREPIAIIGMGCRLPGGANSPREYWRLLSEGRDAISPIPPERWTAASFFSEDPEASGKMYVAEGGFLDLSPYDFDPRFFGISPKEAKALDPQQRLLLETAWEALEHAGIDPASLMGSRTGVFIGISSSDFESAHIHSDQLSLIDAYSMTGITFSTAAGRISYTLGLEGPSFPVDTACSSSLVALHLACRSLREGECDLALVGGVNLMLAPEPLIAGSKLRALSPDGRCKTFDASANGYGRGEGCGMIVLKRLDGAQRDADRVLAVVKGSALNNDGRSNGLTAPNGVAQRRVIGAALEDGNLQPGDIDYVEAHGTGTPLGDPIEIEAIAAVLGQGRDAARPLLVGSAKTNIGHLEAAAGVAGIIKLVLSLNREHIPPHLHFRSPNPHLAWDRLPLRIVSGGAPWPRSARPRRAGISGFGFSGTNAHVILEEAPLAEKPPLPDGRGSHLLVLSASDQTALRALAGRYAEYLQSDDLPQLSAICNTAATGRSRFPFALAAAGATPRQLAQRLTAFAGEETTTGVYPRSQPAGRQGPVFLFTGQGSQYPGMGKELYQTSPVYREAVDLCDTLFAPLLRLSIRDLMHNGSEEELARTVHTQPAIFCLEYALARLWQSWGVIPSAVLGHSIGEFVAACIAGIMPLEHAVTLVAHRGRLMNALPAGGVMAAALCPEAEALPALAPFAGRVSVAAVNSPGTVVISGEQAAVAAVLEALKQQGVSCQYLTVSHAFHSHLMDPALDEFERIAAGLTFQEPLLQVISNVTGRPALGDDLRTAWYWRRHLRQAVRFGDSIDYLKQRGNDLFLEIGASATLSSFVRQGAGAACRCTASLKRGVSPWSTLAAALGELFAAGVDIDWKGYDAPYQAGKVAIPTYPFQRERHFMDPVREPVGKAKSDSLCRAAKEHPLVGSRLDSPSPERRFSSAIGTGAENWLTGHTIYGAVILPAAAYLEMALAAAASEGLAAPLVLEQARFLAPLVLTQETRRVQTIYRPETGGVEVFSSSGDQRWSLHAGMKIRSQPGAGFSSPAEIPSPGELLERDGSLFYADLLEKGYSYGGVFRSIGHLALQGSEITGVVEIPAQAAKGFVLHPALLDGCLTLAGASFLYGAQPLDDSVLFVPAAIESLIFSGRSVSTLTVCCRQKERNRTSARFDLFASDGNGEPVLQITGLTLRRVAKEQLVPRVETPLAALMYSVQWRELALASPSPPLSGRWLVLSDGSSLSEALCAALKGAGAGVVEIRASKREAAQAGVVQVDPLSPAQMERLAVQLREGSEPVTAIVSLWGDAVTGNLNLVRGLLAAHLFKPLFLVTAGVHDPTGMERGIRPEGAALWGFGASVASEMPELSCRLLDLSPWPGNEELALLVQELASSDGEDRVALRGGRRFVQRLSGSHLPERRDGLILPEQDGFRLDVEERGSLEGLCVRTSGRRPPESGELEVRVRAVGLNFRDVLNVLGRYPGDPGIPGFECSGEITGVGSGIEGFAVGDRVFVFNTDGCIADYLNVSSARAMKIPDDRCFEEAAAIPVAFLTAWHALHNLAGMAKGDLVLIHAAAGGVGLAAVQLCLAAGAIVFATAGSPEKRELLQSMGVRQVMDSRSLAFAEQIRAATDGRGVDIVLNSLAGEFIDKSLELLCAGGRFIEIGKSGTLSGREIGALYPQIAYRRFDLADITEQEPALVLSMFRSLFSLFDQGTLQPLPMTVFPVQRARDAFRFMAQARHIGKVIISLADRFRERRMADRGIVDPNATYLVTGGLGALGLAVAGWLAREGCRNLVLVGRNEPGAEAAASVEKLRQAGVEVAVMAGDVAQASDVARIMTQLRAALPPLKGIFHAAGVLDDSMLVDLDAERLERVMRPKVAGAWNLHRITERDDLDLFVLFSSLTAVTGSPGQANYAAANAALDGFARWRRSRGLAAVSINWGPWGEAGMAAREGMEERLCARGIRSITVEAGLQALAAVLRANPVQRSVADLDLQRLSSFIPSTGVGLYSGLFSQSKEIAGDTVPVRSRLDGLGQASAAQRPALMLLMVQELAARVMGQSDPGRIESDRPLQEQGFDSLMSVDLRNLIARTFSVELPVSLLFDYPTPEKVGRFLLNEVLKWSAEAESATLVQVVDNAAVKTADDLVNEIEQLLA